MPSRDHMLGYPQVLEALYEPEVKPSLYTPAPKRFSKEEQYLRRDFDRRQTSQLRVEQLFWSAEVSELFVKAFKEELRRRSEAEQGKITLHAGTPQNEVRAYSGARGGGKSIIKNRLEAFYDEIL